MSGGALCASLLIPTATVMIDVCDVCVSIMLFEVLCVCVCVCVCMCVAVKDMI